MLCFSQHSSVSVGPVLKYQVSQLFLGCQIKAGSQGLAGVRGAVIGATKREHFPIARERREVGQNNEGHKKIKIRFQGTERPH